MSRTNDPTLNNLQQRLDLVLKRQETLYKEVNDLRANINSYKLEQWQNNPTDAEPVSNNTTPEKYTNHQAEQQTHVTPQEAPPATTQDSTLHIKAPQAAHETGSTHAAQPNRNASQTRVAGKSNIEKFIGDNLINKIGIIITVIGVAIGAKYAIENNLINPLTRIIFGYLSGLALLGVGMKLKARYENYSAVLVSGAIAIFYFITFAGYSFYDLVPQTLAFVLMFVFTTFSVVAAINYNKQVIAHIGLVGAYAVPFLLSDGSGKVAVLFSYMAIINTGILVIAFKKYWKPLYYVSFGISWLIYLSWAFSDYEPARHLVLGLLFTTVTFLTFYAIFLAYTFVKKEDYRATDGMLLLLNSFIFCGLGYYILSQHETGGRFLGLFTAFNAIVHFVVVLVIYKRIAQKSTLFYLIAGLVLTFITITIPVQLDGNWVTLLWAGEAALLFWLGRIKNVALYEKASFFLVVFAFISLLMDWFTYYNFSNFKGADNAFKPLINAMFLTSVLVIAAMGFIFYHQKRSPRLEPLYNSNVIQSVTSYTVPAFMVVLSYLALRLELSMYWEQLYQKTMLVVQPENAYRGVIYNKNIADYGTISILLYTLAFFGACTFVNIFKTKSYKLGILNIILNGVSLLVFLTQGLLVLSELRDRYLDQSLSAYYHVSNWNLGIRYLGLPLIALLVYATYKLTQRAFMSTLGTLTNTVFKIALHIIILWILSSELLHWMDMYRTAQSYKLGLSILWGCYALLMVVLGIWQGQRFLRLGGMVLFGAALLKLFLYDIAHLNTISKTIVFVSLGVLLLIVSFLYTKYKDLIHDDAQDKP